MAKYLFLLVIVCSVGCGYKLAVDKRLVVTEVSGYLVFFKNEMIFYEYKRTDDTAFLTKNHLNGFRIDKTDYEWLDSMAIDYSVYISKEPPGATAVSDIISVLPVSLKYYLGKQWDGGFEKIDLYYYINGKPHLMKYRLYDFRNILKISPIRNKQNLPIN